MKGTEGSTIPKDLVAASAAPLVLSILRVRESYGYAIIKKVKELSGDRLQWTDGMLYPVLHRMEDGGMIVSAWREAGPQRKRKYYRITEAGLRELASHRERWEAVHAALRKAFEEGEA